MSDATLRTTERLAAQGLSTLSGKDMDRLWCRETTGHAPGAPSHLSMGARFPRAPNGFLWALCFCEDYGELRSVCRRCGGRGDAGWSAIRGILPCPDCEGHGV